MTESTKGKLLCPVKCMIYNETANIISQLISPFLTKKQRKYTCLNRKDYTFSIGRGSPVPKCKEFDLV